MFLMNFTKAFEVLNRRWLMLALQNHHVPLEIIEVTCTMFQKTTLNIKLKHDGKVCRSPDSPIMNGGDILSPSFFLLGFDSIIRKLQSNQLRRQMLETFASEDDLAFISTTMKEVTARINTIFKLKESTGLKISYKKAKIVNVTEKTGTPQILHEEIEEQDFSLRCSQRKRGYFSKAVHEKNKQNAMVHKQSSLRALKRTEKVKATKITNLIKRLLLTYNQH